MSTIHDILLSALNYSDSPATTLITSGTHDEFIHPGERSYLLEIIKIIDMVRETKKFTKTYGEIPHNKFVYPNGSNMLEDGLYLRAFSTGVNNVLDEFFVEIVQLEKCHLEDPHMSLMFIYQKLQAFEPLLLFLRQLIRGIETQKLHGCLILQHVQEHSRSQDQRVIRAIKIIRLPINMIFIRQLTQWLMCSNITDEYREFFIQASCPAAITMGNDKSGSVTPRATPDSDNATATSIWHYEIAHDLVPNYFTISFLEKVLFIGQTVLIFKKDEKQIKATPEDNKGWSRQSSRIKGEDYLWNKRDRVFYGKIQALEREDELSVNHYESVISEIKIYVTKRLSEVAVKDAKLLQQLQCAKDFFLMGRGELFLEYIRLTYNISKDDNIEYKWREYVKAFQTAAVSVGAAQHLEQFSINLPKSAISKNDKSGFIFVEHVEMQFNSNWPLHLLFSHSVIERYNKVFRFLLQIKKIQYELHMIWNEHTHISKTKDQQNYKVMHLRNQLMFFVDHLQYYIQVNVLESQFSVLMSNIRKQLDFEEILKHHSIFQANILSLCFLLTDEDASSMMDSSLPHSCNPIYVAIKDIFNLCEDFCIALKGSEKNLNLQIDDLNERLGSLMKALLDLLVNLKTSSYSSPLAQLLLRLDFNSWFSSANSRAKKA